MLRRDKLFKHGISGGAGGGRGGLKVGAIHCLSSFDVPCFQPPPAPRTCCFLSFPRQPQRFEVGTGLGNGVQSDRKVEWPMPTAKKPHQQKTELVCTPKTKKHTHTQTRRTLVWHPKRWSVFATAWLIDGTRLILFRGCWSFSFTGESAHQEDALPHSSLVLSIPPAI